MPQIQPLPYFLSLIFLSTAAFPSFCFCEEIPSFRRDVMPILFRAGCNSGTCHGSARGKDGFMLSLFGYDPKGDYDRIVHEMIGRRVNVAVPDQSLLLLKAIGDVPHTGGKLFAKDTVYYKTLLEWIEAGAPDDAGDIPTTIDVVLSTDRIVFNAAGESKQVEVTAKSSDGGSRQATQLARYFSNNESVAKIDANGKVIATGPGDTYVFARFSRFTVGIEVIVLPDNPNFVWSNPQPNNYIDELVFDRLQKLRIEPSDVCDDETFLRRITLDLIGRPPTVAEYNSFINNPDGKKRSAKIEELLQDEAFSDLWTAVWAEQLRVIGGNYAPVATDVKAADTYYRWIHKQISAGRPLNEFIADMVTASGSNLSNGPVNVYTMMVHKPQFEPKSFTADFSQLFLGIQIQCAECHNHPFDRWSMDDYYSWVSFFTGIKRKPGIEPRERRIFYDTSIPPAKHLVDGRPMPPRVLGGTTSVPANIDPRRELARWLTSSNNDLFSRNLANRIWAHYLGRGIVEPVDDMRASNPPVNGPLLDAIAKRLVDSQFNLRALVSDICNSKTYQMSVKPNQSNAKDTRQFSHGHLRRLRSDVLLDSIVAVTNVPRRYPGFPEGTKAVAYYPREAGSTEGQHFGEPFFETFGRSSRATVCACETKKEPTLSQSLHLAVGDTIRDRLSNGKVVETIAKEAKSPEEAIEKLFIHTLTRKPTYDERKELASLLEGNIGNAAVMEDIFWSLLNSTEFGFNH